MEELSTEDDVVDATQMAEADERPLLTTTNRCNVALTAVCLEHESVMLNRQIT